MGDCDVCTEREGDGCVEKEEGGRGGFGEEQKESGEGRSREIFMKGERGACM